MNKKVWNKFFKKRGRYFLKPDPQIGRVVSKLRSYRVKKILDLGCGSGRHIITLSKAGFQITGMDFSKAALDLARKWIEQEEIDANLINGDIHQKLPFDDESFDAVVAFRSMQYKSREAIKFTLRECNRILAQKGLFFMTLPTKPVSSDMTHLTLEKSEIENILKEHFKKVGSYTYSDREQLYAIFGLKEDLTNKP